MNKRLFLMKAHALLAAFILPVALMYIVTGALYTWGQKGSYDTETFELERETPLQPDLEKLTALAKAELENRGIDTPEGKPKLKTYGTHFLLEWTGSSMDVILEPAANPSKAKLSVKQTSWYRKLVQLHKAKGGVAFKYYAVLLSLAILFLLVSGFAMAWQTPSLKRMTAITTVLGIISFFVFVSLG